MASRALIVGCGGPALTAEEADFLGEAAPWGLILFRRNIESPDQVRRLVASFRERVGSAEAPVLVDQEGGRVQRLGPPHWPLYPPARAYAAADPAVMSPREAARLGARLIAHDLAGLGITVDCLPVLDVPVAGAHDVIGDRAYGGEADAVSLFGRAAAEGLLAGCVLPVIKHVPGHGRAGADSHRDLPLVTATRAELEASDFAPFRVLADMPLAMTAHVLFAALDPERPATISPTVIGEVIRGTIGFDGLLMTDDLSMQALSGSLGERTRAAFAAGCDIALHCNGELDEMRAVAANAPVLEGAAQRRAEAALARLRHAPEPLDPVEARARLAAALAAQG